MNNSSKIIKIFIIIFVILFLKYNLNTYDIKDSFKTIQEDNYNLTILNDIHNKINQKNFSEALNIISKLLTNNKTNNKILYLRAKIYYEISEYYKSLKDCEKYLNLSNNSNNIEIYHLLVLNYIKMFDLENAKKNLKICEQIDRNNLINADLFVLIQKEERKNEENIRKYKQYPAYLNFMKNLYKMGLYLNKIEISFISESYRFCIATDDISRKDLLLRIPLESLITKDVAKKGDMGVYFTEKLEKKISCSSSLLISNIFIK